LGFLFATSHWGRGHEGEGGVAGLKAEKEERPSVVILFKEWCRIRHKQEQFLNTVAVLIM